MNKKTLSIISSSLMEVAQVKYKDIVQNSTLSEITHLVLTSFWRKDN